MQCHSYHIRPSVYTINILHNVDINLDYLGEIMFVKFLHYKITSFPSFLIWYSFIHHFLFFFLNSRFLKITFDTNVCSLILSFCDNTPDFSPLFWLLLFHPNLNVHLPREKRWSLFGPYSAPSPSVAPFSHVIFLCQLLRIYTSHVTSELQVQIFNSLINISSWMFYGDQSAN